MSGHSTINVGGTAGNSKPSPNQLVVASNCFKPRSCLNALGTRTIKSSNSLLKSMVTATSRSRVNSGTSPSGRLVSRINIRLSPLVSRKHSWKNLTELDLTGPHRKIRTTNIGMRCIRGLYPSRPKLGIVQFLLDMVRSIILLLILWTTTHLISNSISGSFMKVRDKELGNWVANQRKRASQNKLRQDRKDILQKIQFSWSLNKVQKKKIEKDYTKHEEKWNAMFQKLKRYECQHGDSQVAYNYPEDPALGMWVSTQRRVYNKRTYMYGDQKEMHQSRKDLLDSIAFDFFPQPPGNNDSQKETFVHQSSDDGSSDDDEGKIFTI